MWANVSFPGKGDIIRQGNFFLVLGASWTVKHIYFREDDTVNTGPKLPVPNIL